MTCHQRKIKPNRRGTVIYWYANEPGDEQLPCHTFQVDWDNLDRQPPSVTIINYRTQQLFFLCRFCKRLSYSGHIILFTSHLCVINYYRFADFPQRTRHELTTVQHELKSEGKILKGPHLPFYASEARHLEIETYYKGWPPFPKAMRVDKSKDWRTYLKMEEWTDIHPSVYVDTDNEEEEIVI